MSLTKTIFLRNDDVRGSLDKQLIDLTAICIKHKVPISHAIEPANINKEVVEWLLDIKNTSPSLIEIIQHGYDHNHKNPELKMEFGGKRSYEDQLASIQKGKQLMNEYFGELWSPVFTFPYGTYNYDSLRAIEKEGYYAISSKINHTIQHKIKNSVGKILKQNFILGKKINYHPGKRTQFHFSEFSVSANLIKSYKSDIDAVHYTMNEVRAQIKDAEKNTDIIGILFHHRYHNGQFSMLEELIAKLKDNGYRFSTIMDLMR